MASSELIIEFSIGEPQRFETLHRLFLALKECKDRVNDWEADDQESDIEDEVEIARLKELLDDEARAWFATAIHHSSEESRIYRQLWDLTAPEIRLQHPMFNRPGPWGFGGIIETIFDGEYELVDLRRDGPGKGILVYDPWSAPFGGTECLVELIEAFGHRVGYDAWHDGPHERQTVGWDYALARQLVEQGRGFVPDDSDSDL